jgi:hypothetical protein
MTWCPPIGRRHHQYDFWKEETPPPGGNGVWVSRGPIAANAPEREAFLRWSPARRVDIVDPGSGVIRRSFYYHLCRGYTGRMHPRVEGY